MSILDKYHVPKTMGNDRQQEGSYDFHAETLVMSKNTVPFLSKECHPSSRPGYDPEFHPSLAYVRCNPRELLLAC